MRNWIFIAVCVMFFAGLTQIENTDSDTSNIYTYVQGRQWKTYTSTPTLKDLNEREFVLLVPTTTLVAPRIYTKSKNTLWWINLSSGG